MDAAWRATFSGEVSCVHEAMKTQRTKKWNRNGTESVEGGRSNGA